MGGQSYQIAVSAPGAQQTAAQMAGIGNATAGTTAKLSGLDAALQQFGARAVGQMRKGEGAAHLMGRALGNITMAVAGGAALAGLAAAKDLWRQIVDQINEANTAAEKHGLAVAGVGSGLRVAAETWGDILATAAQAVGLPVEARFGDKMAITSKALTPAELEKARQESEKKGKKDAELLQDAELRTQLPDAREREAFKARQKWQEQLHGRIAGAEFTGDSEERDTLEKLRKLGAPKVALAGGEDLAKGERDLRARWKNEQKIEDDLTKAMAKAIEQRRAAEYEAAKALHDRRAALSENEFERLAKQHEGEVADFNGSEAQKTDLLAIQLAERDKLAMESIKRQADAQDKRLAEIKEDVAKAGQKEKDALKELLPELRGMALTPGMARRRLTSDRRESRSRDREEAKIERRARDAEDIAKQRGLTPEQARERGLISAQGQAASEYVRAKRLVPPAGEKNVMQRAEELLTNLITAVNNVGFRGN